MDFVSRQDPRSILIVVSGLPGTGKTTLARLLAIRIRATYLRVDAIEHALRRAGSPVGSAGYAVANALAEETLHLGGCVVADCVDPVGESRLGWRGVASRASATKVDFHLTCSDQAEHRRRVEGRVADLEGFVLPSWADVLAHEFQPRDDDHIPLDTSAASPVQIAERCEAHIATLPWA